MAKRKPLVCQHLEHISGEALEEYQDLIQEYVRGRHGVYALYNRGELYYVGLATNLRNRLKHHLKNKHKGCWDRFSVYLTIGDSHLKELESLVLRITRPEGNSQSGKFARSEDLKRRLKRDLTQFHKRRSEDLLGVRRRPKVMGGTGRTRPELRGVPRAIKAIQFWNNRPIPLRARYKGKLYRARIRRDGRVRHNRQLFQSPSMAAAAVREKATNGWRFWLYERAPGDWVPLDNLRR